MSKIFKITVALTLLLLPLFALAAQFQNPLNPSGSGSTTAEAMLTLILENIIIFLLRMVGLVSLAALAYGGLRLVLGAAGSEQEVARAKQIIYWAIIGLVVVGMAVAILGTVRYFLGLGT